MRILFIYLIYFYHLPIKNALPPPTALPSDLWRRFLDRPLPSIGSQRHSRCLGVDFSPYERLGGETHHLRGWQDEWVVVVSGRWWWRMKRNRRLLCTQYLLSEMVVVPGNIRAICWTELWSFRSINKRLGRDLLSGQWAIQQGQGRR